MIARLNIFDCSYLSIIRDFKMFMLFKSFKLFVFYRKQLTLWLNSLSHQNTFMLFSKYMFQLNLLLSNSALRLFDGLVNFSV